MRRLPVYLLLDTSGSMMGEPIEAVKNGMQVLISALRQDPYALETAYLSVITFNSSAQQLVPLTDLLSFQVPEVQAGGGTSLGAGLSLLAQSMANEVHKTTEGTKGDWKPIVFLMTDGAPTDDWAPGLAALRNVHKGLVVCCAAGAGGDMTVLKQISDVTVELATADSNAIAAFFKWVSASVTVGSQRVESGGKEVTGLNELPPPPPEVNVIV